VDIPSMSWKLTKKSIVEQLPNPGFDIDVPNVP
jgi:hypothetical protein